jgi:hypothetical protein
MVCANVKLSTADDKTANREVRVGSLFALAHCFSHASEQGKEINKTLTMNVIAILSELSKKPFYAGLAAHSLGLICRYCDVSLLPNIDQSEVCLVLDKGFRYFIFFHFSLLHLFLFVFHYLRLGFYSHSQNSAGCPPTG